VRTLAARLGDWVLRHRATRLLWLGPLLVGVGWGLDRLLGTPASGEFGRVLLIGAIEVASAGVWMYLWVGLIDRLRRDLMGAFPIETRHAQAVGALT
jgi:hypothetical protein